LLFYNKHLSAVGGASQGFNSKHLLRMQINDNDIQVLAGLIITGAAKYYTLVKNKFSN